MTNRYERNKKVVHDSNSDFSSRIYIHVSNVFIIADFHHIP